MKDWICLSCGHRNDGYAYQCRACQQPRALEKKQKADRGAANRPPSQTKSLYAVLGVDEGASDAEIHSAYRRRIKQVHPDVNPGYEEEARQVLLAHEVLGDPEKRREYDQSLKTTVCPLCGEEFDDRDKVLEHMDEHLASPLPADGCQICGRHPSGVFSFQGNRGFIIFRQVYGFEGRLCRSCAKGMYRAVQTRNLEACASLVSPAPTVIRGRLQPGAWRQ